MAWPYTPLVTFLPNDVPAYSADFGNQIQEAINDLYNGILIKEFGDGSDSDADLDGVNVYSWASLVGTTYTLNRSVSLAELIVGKAVGVITVIENGFELLVQNETIVRAGGAVFHHDGGPGGDGVGTVNGAGGTGAAVGTFAAGTDGGHGGGGGGEASDGIDTVVSLSGSGGLGQAGGAAAGGVGGVGNAPTAFMGNWRTFSLDHPGFLIGFAGLTAIEGGAGGGGGGRGNIALHTAGGGGGGGGGGLRFASRLITLLGDLTIRAAGGAGGDPDGAGNANGGAGGSGGLVYCVYMSIDDGGHTFTVSAPGGVPGAGTSEAGTAGKVYEIHIGA